MSQKFKIDVWQSFVGSVHQNDFQEDVIVVDFDKSFCVDGVREASKLVNFRIDVFLDISQEIFIPLSITKCIRYLFSDIKIRDRRPALELPKNNLLIRLSNHELIIRLLHLLEQPRVPLEEFLENPFALVCQNLLYARNRLEQGRSGQNFEAELHSLDVGHVFLMALEERADDQRRVDRHPVEFFHV